jgi:hypothetical protein
MSGRILETTVTFKHSFALGPYDMVQPAGTYRLVTEDEEIASIASPAYRRVVTLLFSPAVSVPAPMRHAIVVDVADLEAALEADARRSTSAMAHDSAAAKEMPSPIQAMRRIVS